MADLKSGIVGAVGVVGIAVALIAPESIDRAEAEKRIAEATCITAVAYEKTYEVREAVNEVDTVTVQRVAKMVSEYKYNPLKYFDGRDTIELTARWKRGNRGCPIPCWQLYK